MAGLALLQKVSVVSSWLDHLIIGIYFLLGIGAIKRTFIVRYLRTGCYEKSRPEAKRSLRSPAISAYSPECVEGVFSEVRLYGVLGSSAKHPRPASSL